MTDILALGFAMIYVHHLKKASPQKKVNHDSSIEARFWGQKRDIHICRKPSRNSAFRWNPIFHPGCRCERAVLMPLEFLVLDILGSAAANS